MDAVGDDTKEPSPSPRRRDASAHRVRTASGTDSPPAQPVAEKIDEAGVYLTNEAVLYRVVTVVVTAVGVMVDLEDCFGLDVVRFPLAELRSRRLRVVTPARVHT